MVAWAAIGAAAKAAAPTIGKIAGSLLGGFNSSSGGGTDIAGSKHLMDYQNTLQKDYTKWLNENSYSQMRTGLENAGYNPLLAVGATPQSGSVGIANGTEGTTAKGIELQSMASIFNTVANTKLQEQQAKTEQAKQTNLSADTGMKLVDTLYKKGLVSWQERQNYADLAYKKSMVTLNNATTKYTNERARGYNSSTSLSSTDSFGWNGFSLGTNTASGWTKQSSKSW